MALSEFEHNRIERAVGKFMEKRRPPPHIRPKLDLGFRIKGQNVEIFSIRPRWNKPDERSEQSLAKATYVRTLGTWRVFWQRADLKWHRYEPAPEVSDIESFLELVEKDEYSCFFG